MGVLRDEFRQAAIALIEQYELSPARDHILERCSECIHIASAGADDYSATGNSRFGGAPDLPLEIDWPSHQRPDGEVRYANFLCQINFSELPKANLAPLPPRSGMLYLFARSIESAAEPALVDGLFYEGDLARLCRREPPRNEQLLDDEYLIDLKPNRVKYTAGFDCDANGRAFLREVGALCADDRAGERFQSFCFDIPSIGLGQLFGYANAVDAHLRRQVALSQLGGRQHQFADYWDSYEEYEAAKLRWPDMAERYERKRPGVEWILNNAAAIQAEHDRWQQLLRINSNKSMDFWILDADPLYVFVRSEDLGAKRFDELAAEVTQG